MARITIRDLPDHIHEALASSAVRNYRSTEAEIRFALQSYAESLLKDQETPVQTYRESWQLAFGDRLGKLIARMRGDAVFGATADLNLVGVARSICEESPAHFLDCLQGIESPSFDMLDRIVRWSNCSLEWLISGLGTMFSVSHIGTAYMDFFLYDFDNRNVKYSLLRVTGGRYDGDLLCIRHDNEANSYFMGRAGANFMLKNGMGSSGHGNLLRFIKFLKMHCGGRILNSYLYHNNDMWDFGFHHPSYYLRNASQSDWLMSLFSGVDPDDWLEGNRSAWKEVGVMPFGKMLPQT